MTTAPQQNRHPVGARAVFSVRSPGPGSARRLAVTALLDAVRAVIGVRDAELRTAAGGDRTLHLDLVDGADEAAVAWSVTRILDERLGVEVDQTRSVLVDDSVDEGRGVPLDGPQRRVHLERLQVVTGGLDVRVDVALATAAARVVGSASGPAVERTVLRTVAGATLNAVDALLEGRARCGLDQAELTDIGSDRLAVAVVTLLTPGQVDRLAGVALVRGDARQAMVRAVLSALNRRFESLVPESGSSSASWAQSFPPSAPPLAVENTATYRTIMAGPDLPDEPLDGEAEPEPAVAGRGYADVTRSEATQPEATPSETTLPQETPAEVTQPDVAAPHYPRESTRGGRAARRVAAAARDTSGDVPVAQARAAASAAEPEYAASTPLSSPFGESFGDAVGDDPYAGTPHRDPIASPTGELEIAPGPGGSTDLGDWAAATWARLVRNDVTKDGAEEPGSAPADPVGKAPAAQAESYSAYQSATEADRSSAPERTSGSVPVAGPSEPAVDARTSGDLSAAVLPSVFTPPVEPEAYTPPAEPVWSWPTSEEPAAASAEWTPPRWDEPAAAEQPGNVSSPYGRSTNGSGGLGGSYLEREYGALGAQANGTGATAGGRGRHGRAESPVSGQPAATGSGSSGANGYGYGQPGANGYGQGGLGANPGGAGGSGGLNGGPGSHGGLGGLGPASGPAGYGGLGPASGPGGYGGLGPASGGGGYGGGLGPTSGAPGGYGGLGPASTGPAASGPAGPGTGSATPPRRRHAAEPTGTWPVMHDPLGPGGSWADPQPLTPPSQREPSQAERGYRTGEYGILGGPGAPSGPGGSGAHGGPGGPGAGPGGPDYGDRRDQPSPRARRRYADEESGRHGGGNY